MKILPFRSLGTKPRRLLHFEQLATVQPAKTDIFVNLDQKK